MRCGGIPVSARSNGHQPLPGPDLVPVPAPDGSGLAAAARRLFAEEAEWAAHPSRVWGRSTGFPSWDELTGGLHPGEVTVLGARQSSGKTSLALQVALSVAEALERDREAAQVVYVTPEMTDKMLVSRLASIRSRVSLRRIRRGEADPAERQAWRQSLVDLARLEPHFTLRAVSYDIGDLVLDVETLHRERPVALLVVDYLQVVGGYGRSPYEQTTDTSRRLRALANRLEIPILALSQLARPAGHADKMNEPPPSLYELRDSGNVEQDADNVLLLYRKLSMGEGIPTRSSMAQVSAPKQRNGPAGHFTLHFHAGATRFEDLGEVVIYGE